MSTLVNEVPDTGSSGQALKKTGTGVTDYAFQTILEVPSGGSTGQVLTKTASGYAWQTPSGGGMQIYQSLRYNIQGFFADVTVNYTVPSGRFTQVTTSRDSGAASNKWQATAGTAIQLKYDYGSTHYVSFDGFRIYQVTGTGFYAYVLTYGN